MSTELDPIDPRDAVELYLDTRQSELAEATFRSQRARLRRFAEWCHDEGLDNLNDLSGRDLHQYRLRLRERFEASDATDDDRPNPLTIRNRLSTVRVFLRWATSIEAVDETLPEKIVLPNVDKEDRYRGTIIDADHANQTLERLRSNRFGTTEHVIFGLAWRVGCRLGSIHSLDVGDVDTDNNRLTFVHRPDEGTTLKNGTSGERVIAIDDQLMSGIETYVDVNRLPSTDDHGRDPLLTTRHGRPDKSTLREWIYRAQLPCYHSNECPHGKSIPECEWRLTYNRDDCPSTTMPHNVRRGAITHFLSDDVPRRAVSDRCDVSGQTLDQHYDQRSETGKAEQRREWFIK
jgi:integrase